MAPTCISYFVTSNADKHFVFDFLVCFVLKVFLKENPTKAVGFASFIYLNKLVVKTCCSQCMLIKFSIYFHLELCESD